MREQEETGGGLSRREREDSVCAYPDPADESGEKEPSRADLPAEPTSVARASGGSASVRAPIEPSSSADLGRGRPPSPLALVPLALVAAIAVTFYVVETHRDPAEPPRRQVSSDASETEPPVIRKGAVEILARESWRARKPTAPTGALDGADRITIHHFGDEPVETSDKNETAALLLSVQKNHQQMRKWVDIGYHYVVDRAGRIWEGREERSVGAHAGSGANEHNLGVLVLGSFDRQKLTLAQANSLERLIDALREEHSISRARVFTHAEVRHEHGLGATTCPGRRLAAWVERYRDAVERGR